VPLRVLASHLVLLPLEPQDPSLQVSTIKGKLQVVTVYRFGAPGVFVWDHLRMRLVAPLREFFEANTDWLTVFQLPAYAPDLNPQEGIWSLVKRGIGNLAAADLRQITRQ
ncbi:transposase, partial [Streptomyces sp. NPDC091278]|uniref:transposase n=1 Tax=Streptomyces sp. NPDC091278 TaxID=3155301 RepID=UPI00344D54FC